MLQYLELGTFDGGFHDLVVFLMGRDGSFDMNLVANIEIIGGLGTGERLDDVTFWRFDLDEHGRTPVIEAFLKKHDCGFGVEVLGWLANINRCLALDWLGGLGFVHSLESGPYEETQGLANQEVTKANLVAILEEKGVEEIGFEVPLVGIDVMELSVNGLAHFTSLILEVFDPFTFVLVVWVTIPKHIEGGGYIGAG